MRYPYSNNTIILEAFKMVCKWNPAQELALALTLGLPCRQCSDACAGSGNDLRQ